MSAFNCKYFSSLVKGINISMDVQITRMCAVFSGRVQGVGFRFTVCRFAKQLQVTGYVTNLHDDTVEIIAEGSEDELVKLLHAVLESPLSRYITTHDVSWHPAQNDFKEFGVRY